MSRFAAFTREELEVIHDGLLPESELNPNEDPSFPRRVETADRLLAEIAEILNDL